MPLELINDLLGMVTTRPDGRLWGTEVSEGFYYPLFSSYKSDPTQVPFCTQYFVYLYEIS